MAQTQSSRPSWWRWLQGLQSALQIGGAGIGIAGVAVLLLWLAGVFHGKVPSTAPTREAGSIDPHRTAEVRRIRRPQYETAVGTVKPVHEVALASKLLAKVIDVRVKSGQLVEAGELLVKLDDADLAARLKQAEAANQAALAGREQAIADLDRAERLVKSKALSRAEYDAAVAAARSSEAEVNRTGQVIAETRVLLSYAGITSPIAGTVVDKRVEAGDTVTPGQVLLTLYDPQHMQMVAAVRESLAQHLRIGQQVPARLELLKHDCTATVSEIVPEANVASRSFQVKVIGPCPPGVYSGMFGRLMIPLEDEEVLVIPATAVRQVGQLSMVDVILDGQTERRSVQLGRILESEYEVLSGLRAGEKVAVRGSESPQDQR